MADTEPTKTSEPSRPEQQEPEPVSKEAGRDFNYTDAEPTTDAADKPQPESTDNAEEEKKPAETSADAEADASADKADGGEGGEAAGTTDQAAAETATNGASSAPKKAANGKRKSTAGPGQKKLGKKKSMNRIYHLDVQPGEVYLARMKSHPPWPSIVCDEEMLPPSLLSTRPVTTKRADGTYAEAYSDGGKKVNERTFPVMFMATNEFAWIHNADLTPLTPEECKDVSEKGKSKNLIAAYQVAAEGHDLDYFKEMLNDFELAVQQAQAEQEAKAAAKAAKEEKKKKRKSMEVVEGAEDEEMEDAGEKKKSTKKRKKDLESEGEQEKPMKTPKSATKLKLTTPKAPATGEKATKKAATTTGKSSKGKSKKKAEASDEEVETPKEVEKPVDPQEAKAKREKEILYLRYKLQKGFLTRDQAPEESEMELMSTYINKLEAYTDLEVSIIRSTKINKVLKAIIKLPTIPKEEEYNFRGRSVQILSKWKQLLESDIPSAGEGSTPADKPTSNGVHKKGRGGKKAEVKKEEEKKTEEADEDTAEPSKDGDISMADADDEKPEAEKEEKEAKEEEKADENEKEEKEKEQEEAGTPVQDADAMET
ncbi:PWWP domain-containing protein, variant [Trichophyton interdigitale]|nr:PWWP domain-containing protein, variant [Trichophyton interdigitale]